MSTETASEPTLHPDLRGLIQAAQDGDPRDLLILADWIADQEDDPLVEIGLRWGVENKRYPLLGGDDGKWCWQWRSSDLPNWLEDFLSMGEVVTVYGKLTNVGNHIISPEEALLIAWRRLGYRLCSSLPDMYPMPGLVRNFEKKE